MEVQSLAEKLLFTTVRIDVENSQGQKGSGTGFIFAYKLEGDEYAQVIVTNKHVVQGCPRGSITFILKDNDGPKLGHGHRIDVDDFEKYWFGHPDPNIDIAVIPLDMFTNSLKESNTEVYYEIITSDVVPSEEQIKDFDSFEELVFIGYPNGIWDKKNLLPIIRTGTTATPMFIDFEGNQSFLIDASVFPGSSGSPVFLYNPGMYYSKTGTTHVGTRLLFVGVVAAVFFRNEINDIVTIPIPTQNEKAVAISKEMIDLGVVYKAQSVIDTIISLAKRDGLIK